MSISLKYIASVKKHAHSLPFAPSWEAALNHLLIKGLAKQQRKIFDYCKDAERTSQEIAARFGISIYHASTTLKHLYNLTLLDREEYRNEEGKFFVWKAKI